MFGDRGDVPGGKAHCDIKARLPGSSSRTLHKVQSGSDGEICPSSENPLHTGRRRRRRKIFDDNMCLALANAQRGASEE